MHRNAAGMGALRASGLDTGETETISMFCASSAGFPWGGVMNSMLQMVCHNR